MRTNAEDDKAGLDECAALGLHPRICPNDFEDAHHSDFPISYEDKAIASAIAYFVGCVQNPSGMETSSFNGRQMPFDHLSSIDQWSIIARALRLHGLKIADR